MPDRKKVIKGLEHCQRIGDCGDCPYQEDLDPDVGCGMHADALALLREQEPVVPSKTLDGNGYLWRDCGKCGGVLPKNAQYCPTCGRKVKWDG